MQQIRRRPSGAPAVRDKARRRAPRASARRRNQKDSGPLARGDRRQSAPRGRFARGIALDALPDADPLRTRRESTPHRRRASHLTSCVSAVENRAPLDQNPVPMTSRSKLFVALAAIAMAMARPKPLLAGSPPQDLVKLERLVSLELAHVRDNGPVDDAKRKQLFNARQPDQKGEDSTKSRHYKCPEVSLRQARGIFLQPDD